MRDDLRDFHDQCRALAHELDRDGDELVEWWSERAAIREVDGGLARTEAETAAFADLRASLAEPRRGPLRAGSLEQVATKRSANDE